MNINIDQSSGHMHVVLLLAVAAIIGWFIWPKQHTWPPTMSTVLQQSHPFIEDYLNLPDPIEWAEPKTDYVSKFSDTVYAVETIGYCKQADGHVLTIEYVCLMSYPFKHTDKGSYQCSIMSIKRDGIDVYTD